MSVATVAHLNFDGRAREALEFYCSVFDGRTTMATYGDFGMPADAPGADRIVWGQVVAANGFTVMAYDVPGPEAPVVAAEPTTRRENGVTLTREPFFLSVRGESAAEVEPMWTRLAEGSTIIQDFGPVPWSPAYGMLADRFGVTWMLDVAAGW